MTVHVKQQLRGVANGGHRTVGVAPAYEREVGDGVEFAQVWAGYFEEVPHHHVAAPIGGQIRKAVEQIKGAAAGARDNAVDFRRQRFEAHGRIQTVGFDAGVRRDQLIVAFEMEIDELAALAERFFAVRAHKRQIVVHGGHLPDDVVAGDQSFQDTIQRRQTGAGMSFNL